MRTLNPSTDLHALLDASLALLPEYRAGLTSHLPMALHALHALGASRAQMQRFFAVYARRFEGLPRPPEPAAVAPLADWRVGRGAPAAFDGARSYFVQALRERGADAVVGEALPQLWPGVAAAAFHGLIRTAHAVQAGHPGELAAALAYWATRWQPLPTTPPAAARAGFDEWTAALESAALNTRTAARLISERMRIVVQQPAYARLAAGPQGATLEGQKVLEALEPLSGWAAALYARSGNFTVLHVVTGLRAARVLLTRWPPVEGTFDSLLRAVTAAVLGSDLGLQGGAVPVRSWAEVRAAALAADDDHTIKLVHACFDEHTAYGAGAEAMRLAAASRALA